MNAVLVDSSLVLDLFTADERFCEPSMALLTRWGSTHELCINDIVYAEVSVGFSRVESLDQALAGSGFRHLPIPKEALFLAGKAFLGYRRRGGTRLSPLPDFFIGAHAAVSGIPLLTRDSGRIRACYPTVRMLEP
jgi:predicted nucleic acid-binding protein